MSIKDDGGPAFPVAYGGGRIEGMTLRNYFAGKALEGILAHVWADEIHPRFGKMAANELAQECYIMADAMLEASK